MTLAILSNAQTGKSSATERLTWTTEPAPENQLSHGTPHILSVGNDEVAVVVVFNPLAQPRYEVVSVLVSILSKAMTLLVDSFQITMKCESLTATERMLQLRWILYGKQARKANYRLLNSRFISWPK